MAYSYEESSAGTAERERSVDDANMLGHMFVEVILVVVILFITAIIRFKNERANKTMKKVAKHIDMDSAPRCHKELSIDTHIMNVASSPEQVVKLWLSNRDRTVLSSEAVLTISQAFLQQAPENFVGEVLERLAARRSFPIFAAKLLDLVVETADVALVEAAFAVISNHAPVTHHMIEAITSTFAHAGDEERLAKWFEQIRETGPQRRVTARGYTLAVRGLLFAERPEGALIYAKEMLKAGVSLSPFLVTSIFRSFCTAGCASGALEKALPEVVPNSHAAVLVFEHCFKARDIDLAKRFASAIKDFDVELHPKTYETYLRHLVSHADPCASMVLREMHGRGMHIPAGFCVSLLSHAAESKFVEFAEDLIEFARHKLEGTNITLYGALMKVYSCCHNVEKACDVYYRAKADGLQPDHRMLTCLMRFAVEINREELISELKENVSLPFGCIHWTVRNAFQKGDVEKAFGLMKQQELAGEKLDVATYNYVLDVCVRTGQTDRATDIVGKMRKDGIFDIVTYNTLLKVFAKTTNLKGALAFLDEIVAAGLQPDAISFNIVINIAINLGNINEAWEIIDRMKAANVQPDGYTISIMFKAARKKFNERDHIVRVLDLLDTANVDLAKDEVLVNCVLDTCIKLGEKRRVCELLALHAKSSVQPAVHSFGVLIRAAGFCGSMQRCRELWTEMVEVRQFIPTDVVLGSMTNALVSFGCVDEALALVQEWAPRVQPNHVVYMILLKGFASSKYPERSLEVLTLMSSSGIPVPPSVFGKIIENFVRLGNGTVVKWLLAQMKQSGVPLDAYITFTLFNFYHSLGCFEKCNELLKTIPAMGNLSPTERKAHSVAFDKLLDGYVTAERITEAKALMEDMVNYGVRPSKFTLASVVTLWGCARQLEKAFKAVETMSKTYDIEPDNLVRLSLLKACLANDDMSRAFQVFEIIKSTADGAESKTYEAMINSCARLGWYTESARLVEEACGLSHVNTNFSPTDLDSKMFENLAASLRKAGLMESIGNSLFQRLQSSQLIAPASL